MRKWPSAITGIVLPLKYWEMPCKSFWIVEIYNTLRSNFSLPWALLDILGQRGVILLQIRTSGQAKMQGMTDISWGAIILRQCFFGKLPDLYYFLKPEIIKLETKAKQISLLPQTESTNCSFLPRQWLRARLPFRLPQLGNVAWNCYVSLARPPTSPGSEHLDSLHLPTVRRWCRKGRRERSWIGKLAPSALYLLTIWAHMGGRRLRATFEKLGQNCIYKSHFFLIAGLILL